MYIERVRQIIYLRGYVLSLITYQLQRIRKAFKKYGRTHFPGPLESYLRGENKNKVNWNAYVVIYINMNYQYI